MSTSQKSLTIGEALAGARRRLDAHSESPALDAQVLLGQLLGLSKAQLLAHPERALSAAELDTWDAALRRLEAGEALPYLLGEWEFYGLTFNLTPAVLIPRPETELLVETALDWLRAHPERRQMADVGAGSGAIAVALAANLPGLRVTATDISPEALELAASNIKRHGLDDRIELVEGDLLIDLEGSFDLICANLPYIPSGRLASLEVARREPQLALDGGPDGLALIGRLLEQAPTRLGSGGRLLAEIDDSHGERAPSLARRYYPDAEIQVLPDLAGKPRLLVVQT